MDREHLPEIPLPAIARRPINQHLAFCQNAGLVYERYVKYRRPERDWSLEATRSQKPKHDAIQATINAQNLFSSSKEFWNSFQNRWQRITANTQPFEASPDWRFVTGLGADGPLEVGFVFHRIYGFPIIPGSGLKGLARMTARVDLADRVKVDELENLRWLDDPDNRKIEEMLTEYTSNLPDEEIRALVYKCRLIFGTTDRAGEAVFFDAIPTSPPKLEIDVMTPHHSKYYQGSEPPADWQEPIPVPFLAVSKDTRFLFAVGWRGKGNEVAHRQAKAWLQKGLQELGAGAKTSAGYGYFNI